MNKLITILFKKFLPRTYESYLESKNEYDLIVPAICPCIVISRNEESEVFLKYNRRTDKNYYKMNCGDELLVLYPDKSEIKTFNELYIKSR